LKQFEMADKQVEYTFAFIKPDAYGAGYSDAIIKTIKGEGFEIVAQKEVYLEKEVAQEFYAEHKERAFYYDLVDYMTSAPVQALVLERDQAVAEWRKLIGPTNSIKAREIAPYSIRAQYGVDGSKNAAHGSDSYYSALREIQLVFPELNRTFAMIKPDAVEAGYTDKIVEYIQQEGFQIYAKKETYLTREQAQEFYKEHEGKPFYDELVQFMSSGPTVQMILERPNAIRHWRRVMGPTNPYVAKESAPYSLRALYGSDGSANATHGSDSVYSAYREIGYMFPELQEYQDYQKYQDYQ